MSELYPNSYAALARRGANEPGSPPVKEVLNNAHQGKATLRFGPLPVSYIPRNEDDIPPPEESITAKVKKFKVDGIKLAYADVAYPGLGGLRTKVPISEDAPSGSIQTTLLCDARNYNWYALFRYMRTINGGYSNGYPVMDRSHRVWGGDGVYRNKEMYIPYVDYMLGDDAMHAHTQIRYKYCWPTDLGEISHSRDDNSVLEFPFTFVYTNLVIVKFDKDKCVVQK